LSHPKWIVRQMKNPLCYKIPIGKQGQV
jgi:hypothetical protein